MDRILTDGILLLQRFWCKGLFKVFFKRNILSMSVQGLWDVGSETAGRLELHWNKSWFCKDGFFIHLYKRWRLVNQDNCLDNSSGAV